MKENRILRALGQVDDLYIKEAEPVITADEKSEKNYCKRWGLIAACFALIAVMGIAIFRSGLLGAKADVAILENGEKITFVKKDAFSVTNLDLDVRVRALADEEIKMLFSDLPITANAYFDPDSQEMIGFEGGIGDVKLVVFELGINLLDTVMEGEEYTSTVADIPIEAGYFVNDKTVIYYADFVIGENTIYVEASGLESEREAVKNELADAVWKLIEHGEFDLSQIKREKSLTTN